MPQGKRAGLKMGDLRREVDALTQEGSGFHFSESSATREKRELQLELTKLRNRLERKIHAVVPKCHNCGGTDIRIKTSSHLVDPGNDIIGPAGRGPSFATHLDGLYCENCGAFYYNSQVAALQSILSDIEQAEYRLENNGRRGFRC